MKTKYFVLIWLSIFLLSCAQSNRMGMITDHNDGYQYGSSVEKNLLVDSSQFANSKLKLTLRNISGDLSYDLDGVRQSLENNFRSKGYQITNGPGFGIRYDVNILYSGHVQRNLAGEYAFLGGTAGGLIGHGGGYDNGALVGVIAGAALGAIAGSYSTDDTYIVIVEVSIAITDAYRGKKKKTITFDSSPYKDEVRDSGVKSYQQTLRSKIAVYAGGRNASQQAISSGVRKRIVRIVSDII